MPAVRPKDAASLILVRQDAAVPRVLMGRRAQSHDFVPGKWVFPGGKVERADYDGPLLRDLQPEVAEILGASARLKRQDGPRLARALARAAIRETHEETGLIVGRAADGVIEADLGSLTYVARAITPPQRPKRFDARFLMADVTALPTLDAEDSHELDAVGWFSLDECFDLDSIAITRAILAVVGQHLDGRADNQSPPFWRWTAGNPHLAL